MLKRIYAALGANIAGQVVTLIIQLASVPVFLKYWSLEEYGQWIILTAIPTYFALADAGFLGVSINKMTILAASNDIERVNVIFQTANKLCLFAVIFSFFLSVVVVAVVNVSPVNDINNKCVFVILVLCAIFTMSGGLFDAVFRSTGEFATGVHLLNSARLVEWLGLMSGLILGKTFIWAAIGQLLGRCIATFIALKIARARHPQVLWGISRADKTEFLALLKPALSFLAFPMGNAISIQGMSILVGHLFGTAFLAVFSTYRTVTRVLVQGVTIIGRSLWPEISRKFGRDDILGVLDLYKKGTYASVALAIVMCVILFFSGESLLEIWTSKKVPFDRTLFNVFLLVTTLTSIWQMGMVVLSATNQHVALSISYIVGALASVSVTYATQHLLDEYSSAVGLIFFELWLVIACYFHMREFQRRTIEKK